MADKLWALAVKDDWAHKCAVCGRADKQLHAHHLIPRQWYATRYELMNGICLCASCHQFDADVSPHQNAAGWMTWLFNNHPKLEEWYTTSVEFGDHKKFEGTKNAAYYCDVIRSLKEYVEEDDYTRIVGVKFSRWLEENE